MRNRIFVIFMLMLLVAGCNGTAGEQAVTAPTATLAPILSLTPRFTATPIPSRTPLPSATFTPSLTVVPPTPTETFTPSATPPIMGSVASMNSINLRTGPGVEFGAITALRPGTRLELLGTNLDGEWFNVRLEDGTEGWVAGSLVRIQETPTPFPTLTPSPNLTALFLGTPLPTALFGGGTVTPTPPRSAVTATLPGTTTAQLPNPTTGILLPNIEAINLTATTLAGGGALQPTPITTVQSGVQPTSGTPLGGPTGGPFPNTTVTAEPLTTGAAVGRGVDVLAYCSDPMFGAPPPTNLRAGSTVDVWWSWYAQTEAQVRDHIGAAIYDVRLDGVPFANWRQFTGEIGRDAEGHFIVFWYMPSSQPLTAGQHTITYTVTWERTISDGYEQFGPGTRNPSQSGSCTFTVR